MRLERPRCGSVGPRRSGGFSLIEVLIALLILAFGLLGLAFLQMLNVRYTNSAQQRTMATNLAYEMLDMMRTNHLVLSEFDFDYTTATVPAGGCVRSTGAGAGDYRAKISRWQCEVTASLPGGQGKVELVGANQATVTIRWTDDVGGGETTNQSQSALTEFEVSTLL